MSTWFASKADYGTFLVEDQKIRKFIDKKFNRQMPKGGVAKTEVVRTRNEVTVTLHSARPGVVIGPRGGEVDKLREELEALTGRKVTVNVIEIKEPDLNAFLVAEAIAEQLGKAGVFQAGDEAVLRRGDERRRQGSEDFVLRPAGRG